MTTKHAIIIFGIGYCVSVIGAWFKMMGWPFILNILLLSTILELIGIILFLYKLLTYPKFKDFLNW